jgi:hypothetical protein
VLRIAGEDNFPSTLPVLFTVDSLAEAINISSSTTDTFLSRVTYPQSLYSIHFDTFICYISNLELVPVSLSCVLALEFLLIRPVST